MRARDLGIVIGRGRPGPAQRHHGRRRASASATRRSSRATGRSSSAQGPVRTGVTVVVPHGADALERAGLRRLPPAQRQRRDDRPRVGPRIGHADDAGRDHQHAQRRASSATRSSPTPSTRPTRRTRSWSLPVVGETYDGLLNDINGFHVRPEHLRRGPGRGGRRAGRRGQRRRRDRDGLPRVQGRDRDGVAGRPGATLGGYTVGVLVQANYGKRDLAAGRRRPGRRGDRASTRSRARTTRAEAPAAATPPPGSGSIIVVVATDAPLLPHQCERLAQRAGLGIARAGGTGGHTSGDLFIAFATGNRLPTDDEDRPDRRVATTSGRSATASSTRCSTASSRRPRRRSSTPSSPPRR